MVVHIEELTKRCGWYGLVASRHAVGNPFFAATSQRKTLWLQNRRGAAAHPDNCLSYLYVNRSIDSVIRRLLVSREFKQ